MTDDKQPRTLTAEEVQAELLEDLRNQAELWTRAADEIERLTAALAQSNAEPVAWRWRWHSDPPDVWNFADKEFRSELVTNEPLYTAKPPALIS